MAMKILVIEDDTPTRQFLSNLLKCESFGVRAVSSAEQGLSLLSQELFDLIVLDLGLPGMTGLEMLRYVRSSENDTLVLVLSGDDYLDTKVQSFKLGADDFLSKPFVLRELPARIRALGRRVRAPIGPKIKAGGISLDPEAGSVISDGRKMVLSRTEYLFLELMIRHVGNIVTRQMLLTRMYAEKNTPQEDIIDAYAHRLRKKLARTFNGTLRLVTVWGQGFVLEVNTSSLGDDADSGMLRA